MKDKNWHQLIGQVTENPVFDKTKQGHDVVNFDVKVTSHHKDKSGNVLEKFSYHRICSFRPKTIKYIEDNIRAGQRILVEGPNLPYPKMLKNGVKTTVNQILINDESTLELLK